MNNFGEKVAFLWSVADLLRDAFTAAQARGEIRECDLDLVVNLFVSMVEGQIKGTGIRIVTDLSPEELARRRAEFDKQKEIARGNRAA